MRDRLSGLGIEIKVAALRHQLNKWDLSLKKLFTPARKNAKNTDRYALLDEAPTPLVVHSGLG